MLSMPRAGVLCALRRHQHKKRVPSYGFCPFIKFHYSALQRLACRRMKSILGGILQNVPHALCSPKKYKSTHPPRRSMHLENWARIARTVFSPDDRKLDRQTVEGRQDRQKELSV